MNPDDIGYWLFAVPMAVLQAIGILGWLLDTLATRRARRRRQAT